MDMKQDEDDNDEYEDNYDYEAELNRMKDIKEDDGTYAQAEKIWDQSKAKNNFVQSMLPEKHSMYGYQHQQLLYVPLLMSIAHAPKTLFSLKQLSFFLHKYEGVMDQFDSMNQITKIEKRFAPVNALKTDDTQYILESVKKSLYEKADLTFPNLINNFHASHHNWEMVVTYNELSHSLFHEMKKRFIHSSDSCLNCSIKMWKQVDECYKIYKHRF